MNNRYVLILVSLNPDQTDLSGTKYPDSGFVRSEGFKPDKNIQNGLYGTLWGKPKSSRWMNPSPSSKWCVVKTENSEDLIFLDQDNQFVKFRSGMVVYSGSKIACEERIAAEARELSAVGA